MFVFGPVPSRRLGKSLGVNNIPRKVCSYNCIYCQVGETKKFTIERRSYIKPEILVKEVRERVKNESVDYITFVPDGEPTLDVNLGLEIALMKSYGKVAVITNGSLLYRDDVKEGLQDADLVSVKVDAADEEIWRKINVPHEKLSFYKVVDGVEEFSERYKGKLITETMLVDGVNDDEKNLYRIAELIKKLNVSKAYLTLPLRPPRISFVKPPSRSKVQRAYMIFSSFGLPVVLLDFPEEGEFSTGKDFKTGLLSILSVHPMREEDVLKLMKEKGINYRVLEELELSGKIEKMSYMGVNFYRKK